MIEATYTALAAVRHEAPERALRRLCRHFAHKIRVVMKERAATLHFAEGECALRIERQRLELRITALDPVAQHELMATLDRHLPTVGGVGGVWVWCVAP